MKTKLDTLLGNAFATRSPEGDGEEDRTTQLKLGAHAGGQADQAATAPQVTRTPNKVDRDTQPERSIEELDARRSGALREAVELSERLSKLRASRIEQLEAELVQVRLAVQHSNQRIKELEEDRNQAARSTRQALEKVIEELGS